jgi:hypothetical protein
MKSLARSFADVPAIIRVNGASSDSTVSLPFLNSAPGVAVESARVRTVDGWFNSQQTFI